MTIIKCEILMSTPGWNAEAVVNGIDTTIRKSQLVSAHRIFNSAEMATKVFPSICEIQFPYVLIV
jgi:hypothetical protein